MTKNVLMRSVAALGVVACAQVHAEPTVLANHIGYESKAWKQAVIKGTAADELKNCTLLDSTSQKVFTAKPTKTGAVDQWRDWHFWTWDFSSIEKPGQYVIECATATANVRSFPFVIETDLLERHTLSDVLYYFKGQRASGLLDKADRAAVFSENPEKAPVDARGGWYDATGDYSKTLSHLEFSTYFNPQQTPLVVLNLFRVHDKLTERKDPSFTQYRRRLLDEALYGADYLTRVKVAGGSFYRNVAGLGATKAPEERRLVPGMKSFALKDNKDADWRTKDSEAQNFAALHNYEVSYRGGGGIAIAALAIAGRQTVSGDFSNAQYLQAAEEAFAFLEVHNASLTNDSKENIVDDYSALVAATELYKTTQKKAYQVAAAKRAASLVKRLSGDKSYQHYWRADDKDRPFFHAADAGFPVVSLLTYYEIATPKEQKTILAAVKKSLEFELKITQETNNPFGYARQYVQNKEGKRRSSFFYPHDSETAPWWQGENARLGSLATAARMAAAHFPNDKTFAGKLDAYAWNQLNWILGLNPFDASMLNGEGRNNVQYIFFESYEYTNAPGGIVNGITGGLDNERDIDLNRGYKQTGKDNDWRWAEQWLPHGAWYILAISLR